jgi:hypothetical protein
VCETYNGQSNEADLDVQCQEDEDGNIGVTITASISDACAPNHVQTTLSSPVYKLPSAGPSNPTPSIPVGPPPFAVCYSSPFENGASFGSDPCGFNDFTGDLVLTSVPK